jgi:hypothetical protein
MVSILQERPTDQKFDLSIIISLSETLAQKSDYFLTCLQSLLQKNHFLAIEIILLDDCCPGIDSIIVENLSPIQV